MKLWPAKRLNAGPEKPVSNRSVAHLLADMLADANAEILRLRRVLMVRICDCTAMEVSSDPERHAAACRYRREVEPNITFLPFRRAQ